MSGWSASRLPNALRCAACHVAFATPQRMPAAVPMTQSRRVWPTISMIVGTPRPGSPTIRAQAPSSSISLDAFERLPSLSFRRWMWKALRVPSGRIRGSAKHDRPSGGLREHEEQVAHRRRAEPLVAGERVLAARPAAAVRAARATVVFARTSEPPCFSVIAIPHSALALPATSSGSYVVAVSRGSHSAASSGCARSAGTAANVIVIGQAKPPSGCAAVRYSAVRATWAPGGSPTSTAGCAARGARRAP